MIKKCGSLCIACIILSFVMSGCQATPESNIVTSKNDGVFEAALEKEGVSLAAGNEENQPQQKLESYVDSFENSTGEISCDIRLENLAFADDLMPVVRVTPHEITPEEAEHIAGVLFGDTTIYEYSEEMAKSDLDEIILQLRQEISDRDRLLEYYDGDEELTERIISQYEEMIAQYEQDYISAPETVERKLCDWVFRPLSYYEDLTAVETVGADFENYNKSLYIEATADINGVAYKYKVCNRNESDYRIHNIYAYKIITGPTRESYSLEEQSEDEIRAYAQNVLDNLGIGEWTISSCKTVEQRNSRGECVYHTSIIACPVYNEVMVTYQPQLMSLKTGDAYASNYYYEQIEFDFSGGQLISFEYQSPMDVVEVINEDVELLPFEEIMERFKTQMQIGILDSSPGDIISEASSMHFYVDELEFGLVRTRIKNNETDFYLVPAYTFRGDYDLYDYDGNLMYSSTMLGDSATTLLAINAVDGTIINTVLGY